MELIVLMLYAIIYSAISWVVKAAVPLGLIGLRAGSRLPIAWRVVLACALGAAVIVSALEEWHVVLANVQKPPAWDILAIWLFGKAAALHLNIYQSGFATQLAAPFHPTAAFEAEYEVGCVYPPTSILLFLPLGWFKLHDAAAIWYGVNLAALAADVYLIWRLFVDAERRDILALLAAAAVLLKLSGTHQTIEFGQSNFIALFAVLMFWKDRDIARGGLWLVLGFIAKPLLAVLYIYAILRKKWAAVKAATLTLLLAAIAAWAVLGTQTIKTYFLDSPYSRQPLIVFTEPENQSMLAAIVRSTGWAHGRSPVFDPLYLALAAVLAMVTFLLIARAAKGQDDWPFALVLLFSLLAYPNTLLHYSVLLIVPALILWYASRTSIVASAIVLVLITAEFVAIALSPVAFFLVNAVNWCIFAMMTMASARPALFNRASKSAA